jgi:uncharacterized protein YjiK
MEFRNQRYMVYIFFMKFKRCTLPPLISFSSLSFNQGMENHDVLFSRAEYRLRNGANGGGAWGVAGFSTLLLALGMLLYGSALSQSSSSILSSYSFTAKHAVATELSKELREISGLALSADGRLYAHNDEEGTVFVLDALSGAELRRFDLGDVHIRGDFEGIAVANGTLWLVTSDGALYACEDPGSGRRTPYRRYCTPLSRGNDVEGLCFDPVSGNLLLACKGDAGAGEAGDKAVYEFSIAGKELVPAPRFLLPGKTLSRISGRKKFGPSGITWHPGSQTFLLISSQGRYILEMSADGRILGHARLSATMHRQPEGIAVLRDGSIVISDEGKQRGRLTRYMPLQR